MPLSRDTVVREGLAIVDEVGISQLAFGAVAQRMGVAAPRLYAHVAGLDELRTLIRKGILEQMSDTVRSALDGVTGNAAVLALFYGVREYALKYPFRYIAMQAQTVPDPELADVAVGLLALYNSVVQSFDLEESEAQHAMRRIRAALYGFVSLELAGAFGREDTDESFRRLTDMVIASL